MNHPPGSVAGAVAAPVFFSFIDDCAAMIKTPARGESNAGDMNTAAGSLVEN